jgi:hypothetical protein
MKKRIIHHLDYPKDVDKMLVPLLDVLNSIPGCRTLYSCSGHGKESIYISMGICSDAAFSEISRIFKEMMAEFNEFEIDDGVGPDGITRYERHLGIYSWAVGSLPYKKRKNFIKRFSEALMELVPYNMW